jgi:dienelactone hydrolase
MHGVLHAKSRAKSLKMLGKSAILRPTRHAATSADEMKDAAGVDYQLIVYGGAMHGFTHETATGQQPGVAYHAPSDVRSSAAIATFLGEIFE